MPLYKSSDDRTPDQLIKEVKRRILERAQRIDADWKLGPEGYYIARGRKIRIYVPFDLPDNAQELIEEMCTDSVELVNFDRVIVEKKRWVNVLLWPLTRRSPRH